MTSTDSRDEPLVDAALIIAWMNEAAEQLHTACPYLTELDAARGDADHGVNMDRGFRAIADALTADPPTSGGRAMLSAAAVLRKTMGGTTGPLWSVALRRIGKTLGDDDPAEPAVLAAALRAAADGVSAIGEAQEGENTMLDAMYPAARAMATRVDEGASLSAALADAAQAATEGALATADRAATKGRASYLGERAIGQPDPGATSASLVITALHGVVVTASTN
jgi:dihydroxyacetone kinase-like protein